jgi:hypothetical protein
MVEAAGKYGVQDAHPFPRVADEICVHLEWGQVLDLVLAQRDFSLALLLHGIDAFHQFGLPGDFRTS